MLTKKDFYELACIVYYLRKDMPEVTSNRLMLLLGDFCNRNNKRFQWGKWKKVCTEGGDTNGMGRKGNIQPEE